MAIQLMLSVILSVCLPDTIPGKSLVLANVNVVDIEKGSLIKNVTVTITGNLITGIEKTQSFPADAIVINATRMYLIPGLWDMHAHLSFYGTDALPMLVANGITGVRDMGGDLRQLKKWANDISLGKRIGPRIKMAGPFIDGPKEMSPLRAGFTRVVNDDKEIRSLVDSLKAEGVDFIKVHSRLPRTVFFALAAEAKKQDLSLAVHLPKDVTPQQASDAGVRSLEHTESLLGNVIYEEREAVRDKHTRKALKKLYGPYGKRLARRIANNKNFYCPTAISLYRVKDTGYTKFLAPRLLPILRKLQVAGVPLLAGSDFAWKNAGIRPGYDLHDELALFTQAGMTPFEALQAATINPIKCLNMEDSLGSVTKGKIADLVLLNENPLENISNTKKIHAIILNGRYFSLNQLHDILQKVENR